MSKITHIPIDATSFMYGGLTCSKYEYFNIEGKKEVRWLTMYEILSPLSQKPS